MTTFDRREEAFETMFAHDEELHFKAVARRAKLLAAWAAGLMQKAGGESESYVEAIVTATVADGSDQALFARVRQDLVAADVAVPDAELRAHMNRLLEQSLLSVRLG